MAIAKLLGDGLTFGTVARWHREALSGPVRVKKQCPKCQVDFDRASVKRHTLRCDGTMRLPKHSRHPLYATWITMWSRCSRPQNPQFHLWGGRGIRVCDRWQSFEHFISDMGPKPTLKHTIERINNNGNYEPANCRWATLKEQARNRRSSKMITVNGETKSMAEWCEFYGVIYSAANERIKNGWDPLEAFTTPFKPSRFLKAREAKNAS